MNMHEIVQPRYEVTFYDGQAIATRTMTREQVLAINPQSVDHCLSPDLGIWAFKTAEGEWIEHRGGIWPGLGDTGIKVISATQLNPGEFLTPADIAELTGYATLRKGYALSARLMALREAHRESGRNPHFFQSRRAGGYAIGWNPECRWMRIDRMTLAAGDSE